LGIQVMYCLVLLQKYPNNPDTGRAVQQAETRI